MPELDGAFIFDENLCRSFAVDFGHFVHKTPLGVLKPGSVSDIQKMVGFCRSKNLPIVMRGTGGAAYGQTQVEKGIVIDSSSMKAMHWDGEHLVIEPGALWVDVAAFAHEKGKAPAVLPDTMFISVGGTLNTAGIGETSYCQGAQVDHVVELQVVTGTGELLTCSETQNSELFAHVLGGMGQVGLIVSAKLAVMDSPLRVWTREFLYDAKDYRTYLEDLFAFAESETQGAVGGHLVRGADGKSFTYVLDLTCWSDEIPAWLGKIRGETDGKVKTWSFFEYANRNTQGWLDAIKSGVAALPHPYLAWFLPLERTAEMIQAVLDSPSANLGAGRIALFPELKRNFKREFPRMPDGERLCHMRIYRVVRTGEARPDHLKMLESNQTEVLPLIQSLGGKVYLPFCPLLSTEQRRTHFGEVAEARFAAAKHTFDPSGILTPGAALF